MQNLMRMSILAIAFCFATNMSAQNQDELSVVLASAPNTLEPARGSTVQDAIIARHLFSAVFETMVTLPHSPVLAQSLDYDETTGNYILTLRDDIVWSDGTPITTEDVKFTIERAAELSRTGQQDSRNVFGFIEGYTEASKGLVPIEDIAVEVLDPLHLQIRAPKDDLKFKIKFSDFQALILPKHAIEAHGENWTKLENIVVSGPCLPQKVILEKEIICTKNPNYVKADEMEFGVFHFYFAGQAKSSMRIGQEVNADIIMDANSEAVALARQIYPDSMVFEPGDMVERINFNMSSPLMQDKRVRKAIVLAIDVDGLLDAEDLIAVPAKSLLPARVSQGIEEIALPIEERRQIAKDILNQAGYSAANPLKIKLGSYSVRNKRQYVKHVIKHLEDIGIVVDARLHDRYQELDAEFKSTGLDVTITAWGAPIGEQRSYFLIPFQEKGYSLNNLKRPDIEAQIDGILASTDIASSEAATIELLDYIMGEIYAYPLISTATAIITSERIDKFTLEKDYKFWKLQTQE